MKKIIALLFAVALLISPAFAIVGANASGEVTIQGTDISVSEQTDVNVNDDVRVSQNVDANVRVSPFQIKWRQFTDGISDTVFKIRYGFAFNDESKVELIHDRNEKLKARQEAWVQYKNSLLAEGNETREEIKTTIKAKHEEIINEHLRLVEELNRIKAEARARGDAELRSRTESEIKVHEESKFRFGLGSDIYVFLKESTSYLNLSLMTEADIKARVEGMGFELVNAELKSENGIDVWKVEAKKEMGISSVKVSLKAKITFDARTGVILSLNMESEIEGEVKHGGDEKSQANSSSDEEFELSGSIKRIPRGELGELGADVDTDTEISSGSGGTNVKSDTKASVKVGNKTGASVSVSAGVGI